MRRAGETMGTMLRQAFMTREEYREVREEERVWKHLQRPLSLLAASALFTFVAVGALVALRIIFPSGGSPFCSKHPIPASGITDDSMHSYYFTEYEATQYFWFVAFIPTFLVFFISATYLIAGMAVAYSAPQRHGCAKVVENNCCASKRGGVRCLATMNVSFAIVFALMALFLGSTILTLETDCSVPLFWCYEMICWSLVFLYGGTFCFLRRKAAVIMDEGEFYGSRTMGMELLEPSVEPPSPGMERRVNAGFRSWMGSSILSSDDDEDGPGIGGLDDVRDNNLYDSAETGRRGGQT